MALWQYTFHVLPKESVDALSPGFHLKKDEDGFDDRPYWKYNSFSRDFFHGMNNILIRNKSWSNQIDLYGNQESNCFEVFFENDNVISVSFRIDLTSDYESILLEIIEYCLHMGLMIIDESLNIVPLNMETVKTIIRNSSQVKKYNELSK